MYYFCTQICLFATQQFLIYSEWCEILWCLYGCIYLTVIVWKYLLIVWSKMVSVECVVVTVCASVCECVCMYVKVHSFRKLLQTNLYVFTQFRVHLSSNKLTNLYAWSSTCMHCIDWYKEALILIVMLENCMFLMIMTRWTRETVIWDPVNNSIGKWKRVSLWKGVSL
jgi:hypothetical protein